MPNKYYLDVDGVKTLIEKTTKLGGYVVMIDISGIDDPEQDWYDSSSGQITVTSGDDRRVKVARYQGGQLNYLPTDSNPAKIPAGISEEELIVILYDSSNGTTTYNCLRFNTSSNTITGIRVTGQYSWISSDGQYEVVYRLSIEAQQRSYSWWLLNHESKEDLVSYVCRQNIHLKQIELDSANNVEDYIIEPESDVRVRFFKVYPDGREFELATRTAADISNVRSIFTDPDNLHRTKIQATMSLNDYETIIDNESEAYDNINGSTVIEFKPSLIDTESPFIQWQSTVRAVDDSSIIFTFFATMDVPGDEEQKLPQLGYAVGIVRPLGEEELNAMLNPNPNP